MADLKYHRLTPENFKPQYVANDIVDFNLSFENRKLKMGSVRLNFKLGVLIGNVRPEPVVAAQLLNQWTRYNPLTGAHSMISSISVSSSNYGTMQNLNDYHHYVSTMRNATHTERDMFNSSYTTELAVGNEQLTNRLLYGEVSRNNPDPAQRIGIKPSVSMKPKICINSPVGDPLIPYVKTGDVRISLQLNPTENWMYGSPNVGKTITYFIEDVHLTFQSFDDDGVYSKMYSMKTTGNLRTQMNSNEHVISTKYSMLAQGVVMKFIETDHISDLQNKYDPLNPETLPSVHRVDFQWNNSNEQITYTLDNNAEILENYIKALSLFQEHNHNSLINMYTGRGYGIGLNFGQLVDLSQNKFNVIIRSDVNNAFPFTVFMFFAGQINLN
jgi:hypothetical protein